MSDRPISADLSRKFANMGFFFAMVVVFIHVPHHPTAGVMFMENVFPGFLKGSANAWFFLAAGFFFAGHVGEPGWWRKGVAKRLRTLLVPYLVLNFVMMLLLFGYQRSGFCFPVDAKGSPIWQSVLRAMGFWPCTPVDGPTWFVRSLLFFVLTTPLMIPLLKRLRVAIPFLAALFIVNVVGWETIFSYLGIPTVGWAFCKLYRPYHLIYFLAGVVFQLCRNNEKCKMKNEKWLKPLAILALLIGAALSIYAPMDASVQRVGFGLADNLSHPFVLLGVWGLMTSRPWPKVLTGNAFAIYILHWQLITAAYIVCGKTGTFETIFGNPLWLTVYWFGVVAITIGAAELMRRSNWLKKWVLGGR